MDIYPILIEINFKKNSIISLTRDKTIISSIKLEDTKNIKSIYPFTTCNSNMIIVNRTYDMIIYDVDKLGKLTLKFTLKLYDLIRLKNNNNSSNFLVLGENVRDSCSIRYISFYKDVVEEIKVGSVGEMIKQYHQFDNFILYSVSETYKIPVKLDEKLTIKKHEFEYDKWSTDYTTDKKIAVMDDEFYILNLLDENKVKLDNFSLDIKGKCIIRKWKSYLIKSYIHHNTISILIYDIITKNYVFYSDLLSSVLDKEILLESIDDFSFLLSISFYNISSIGYDINIKFMLSNGKFSALLFNKLHPTIKRLEIIQSFINHYISNGNVSDIYQLEFFPSHPIIDENIYVVLLNYLTIEIINLVFCYLEDEFREKNYHYPLLSIE